MAGELAKSIGLSGVIKMPTQNDSSKLLSQLAKEQRQQKYQEAKSVSSLMDDMVVTDGKLLPAWAEEMKKINADVVSKAQEYLSDGKGNAQIRLWKYYTQNVSPLQQQYKASNDAAIKYINNNNKFLVYDDVVNALSTNSDMNMVQEAISSKKDNNLMGSPDGGFAFIPVSPYNYEKFQKIDNKADYIPSGNAKDVAHNGLITTTQDYTLNPTTDAAKRQMLLNDPNYIIATLHRAPVDIRTDQAKATEFIMNAVDEDMKRFRYNIVTQRTMNAPSGKSSGKYFYNINTGALQNSKINIEPTQGGEELFQTMPISENGGYMRFAPSERWIIDASKEGENSEQTINANRVLNLQNGKWERFNGMARIVEAWRGYNVNLYSGTNKNVSVKHNDDDYILIQNKVNINGTTKYHSYLVPYNEIKEKVKTYTKDKNTDGWVMPASTQEEIQKPTNTAPPPAATKFKNTSALDLLNGIR